MGRSKEATDDVDDDEDRWLLFGPVVGRRSYDGRSGKKFLSSYIDNNHTSSWGRGESLSSTEHQHLVEIARHANNNLHLDVDVVLTTESRTKARSIQRGHQFVSH
jgi:hypothetical protein